MIKSSWDVATPLAGVVVLAALLVTFPGALIQAPGTTSDTAEAPAASPVDFPVPTVTYKAPPDVQIPPAFPQTEIPTRYFDDFSWQTFLALNWPAVEGKRGEADGKKKLGDTSSAVVWGTWKAPFEVFLPSGAEPAEWDSFTAVSPAKNITATDAGKYRQLTSFSRFGPVLADANLFGQGDPVGSLVAQNRTYVRYEIRLNKEHFEYIRTNRLYLAKNLTAPDRLKFSLGSIVVKAAWRRFKLPEERPLLSRYHHVKALLVDRFSSASEEATMGLVGFHIACKTCSRPQWIWSTFEHVDNVKLGGDAPSGTRPTFNNPLLPQQGPKVNVLQPTITRENPPSKNPEPVQVVRENCIGDSTKATNRLYRTHPLVKDTVWKNYELVATQWPSKPEVGDFGKPQPPSKVANTTLETSNQSNSCLFCHSVAGTDFNWMLALRSFKAPEQNLKRAVEAIKKIRGK